MLSIKSIPRAHMNMTAPILSLGTGTSVKSGWAKLVLLTQHFQKSLKFC